jgi:hypothetical protein
VRHDAVVERGAVGCIADVSGEEDTDPGVRNRRLAVLTDADLRSLDRDPPRSSMSSPAESLSRVPEITTPAPRPPIVVCEEPPSTEIPAFRLTSNVLPDGRRKVVLIRSPHGSAPRYDLRAALPSTVVPARSSRIAVRMLSVRKIPPAESSETDLVWKMSWLARTGHVVATWGPYSNSAFQ